MRDEKLPIRKPFFLSVTIFHLMAMLIFFLFLLTYGAIGWEKALSGDFIAYSLREAEKQAQLNGSKVSQELLQIGGITRIVGMVHDPETADVILVGKKVDGLPKANFNDLVVALRTRILNDVWPRVSIDPTSETATTGLQAVSFSEGIENTGFGQRFLDCDVILKNYSLELLTPIKYVRSYKTLCEQEIRNRLKEQGLKVLSSQWLSSEASKKPLSTFYERTVEAEESFMSKFWFYTMDSSSVEERKGVFLIKDLRLGVSKEILYRLENNDGAARNITTNKVADEFSSQFTKHFQEVRSNYPLLKNLDMLFSMIALAEAIYRLENRPGLKYLLYDYNLPRVPTQKQFDLISACGILKRSDGLDYLIQISGGIELKPLLRKLNSGDITLLKTAVLGSRPKPEAIFWRLPLKGWRLPNDKYFEAQPQSNILHHESKAALEDEWPGSSVIIQSYLLGPVSDAKGEGKGEGKGAKKVFAGFSPIPAPPTSSPAKAPKLQYVQSLGGIDIAPEPKGKQADLKKLKENLLKSRPSKDSLSYPVKTQKQD